jgi:hypothetical protein
MILLILTLAKEVPYSKRAIEETEINDVTKYDNLVKELLNIFLRQATKMSVMNIDKSYASIGNIFDFWTLTPGKLKIRDVDIIMP